MSTISDNVNVGSGRRNQTITRDPSAIRKAPPLPTKTTDKWDRLVEHYQPILEEIKQEKDTFDKNNKPQWADQKVSVFQYRLDRIGETGKPVTDPPITLTYKDGKIFMTVGDRLPVSLGSLKNVTSNLRTLLPNAIEAILKELPEPGSRGAALREISKPVAAPSEPAAPPQPPSTAERLKPLIEHYTRVLEDLWKNRNRSPIKVGSVGEAEKPTTNPPATLSILMDNAEEHVRLQIGEQRIRLGRLQTVMENPSKALSDAFTTLEKRLMAAPRV